MGTIRDLRDLINVSRLTYRDSDSETELDDLHETTNLGKNLLRQQRKYNEPSSEKSKLKNLTIRPTPLRTGGGSKYPVKEQILKELITVTLPKKPDVLAETGESSLASFKNKKFSQLAPIQVKLSRDSSANLDSFRSSNGGAKSSERNDDSASSDEEEERFKIKSSSSSSKDFAATSSILSHKDLVMACGNYDNILTYIDAAVVTEWLNRANRYLKKMFKWHQMNTGLYQKNQAKPSSNGSLLRFESFILFANFWLSSASPAQQNPSAEAKPERSIYSLSEKQRRQLIEMEYSIIKEELVQAFQVGIDSQALTLNDIYQLLRAVFKEYPLKFFGMRGNYLVVDYIDILSSDRNDPSYKRLLSDVKCRTVNKQYAQWLLSIRSFALINMCWSIIKFYRKSTAEKQMSEQLTSRSNVRGEPVSEAGGGLSARSRDAMAQKQDLMRDFDACMSNLAVSKPQNSTKKSKLTNWKLESSKCAEFNSSSESSSEAEDSEEEDKEDEGFASCKSARETRCPTALTTRQVDDVGFLSSQKRYDLYIQAVFK